MLQSLSIIMSKKTLGCGWSTVVEHLPTMHEPLVLSLAPQKILKNKITKKERQKIEVQEIEQNQG